MSEKPAKRLSLANVLKFAEVVLFRSRLDNPDSWITGIPPKATRDEHSINGSGAYWLARNDAGLYLIGWFQFSNFETADATHPENSLKAWQFTPLPLGQDSQEWPTHV